MAFPTLVRRASAVSGTTNVTSWTPSFTWATDGAITSGTRIRWVAIVAADGNPTLTLGGGSNSAWSKVGQASNSTVVTGAVFTAETTAAYAASAFPALVIASSAAEQFSCILFAFSISGGLISQLLSSTANGSSTNPNPPILSLPGPAFDVTWMAGVAVDANVIPSAAPTNYGNLLTRLAGGTAGASAGAATREANGTSEDPAPFTMATEQWVTYTLAIYETATAAGSSTTTLGALTSTSGGNLPVAGGVDTALAALTSTSSGELATLPAEGSLTQTLDPLTSLSQAQIPIFGSNTLNINPHFTQPGIQAGGMPIPNGYYWDGGDTTWALDNHILTINQASGRSSLFSDYFHSDGVALFYRARARRTAGTGSLFFAFVDEALVSRGTVIDAATPQNQWVDVILAVPNTLGYDSNPGLTSTTGSQPSTFEIDLFELLPISPSLGGATLEAVGTLSSGASTISGTANATLAPVTTKDTSANLAIQGGGSPNLSPLTTSSSGSLSGGGGGGSPATIAWNPSDAPAGKFTVTNNGLKVTFTAPTPTGGTDDNIRATPFLAHDQNWVFRAQITLAEGAALWRSAIGFANAFFNPSAWMGGQTARSVWFSSGEIYASDEAMVPAAAINSTTRVADVAVAYHGTLRKVFFRIDGTWYGGDPVAGTGGVGVPAGGFTDVTPVFFAANEGTSAEFLPVELSGYTSISGTPGASGIGGSLTTTLAPLTSTSAAALTILGGGTPTLSALTSTSAAALTLKASLTSNLGALTASGSATIRIAGVTTATLAPVTSLSSGVSGGGGTLTATLAPLTSNSAATLAIGATGSPTLSGLTASSAGSLSIRATGSPILAPLTSTSGAGLLIKAASTTTLAPVTSISTATAATVTTGQLASTLAPLFGSSAAALAIRAQGTALLEALTSSGGGVIRIAGNTTTTLAPLVSNAQGVLSAPPIGGALTTTLYPLTLTASGGAAFMPRPYKKWKLFGRLGATAQGSTLAPVSAVIFEGDHTPSEEGRWANLIANLQPVFGSIYGTISGTPGSLTGQMTTTLSPLLAGAGGRLALRGTSSRTLAPLTTTSSGVIGAIGTLDVPLVLSINSADPAVANPPTFKVDIPFTARAGVGALRFRWAQGENMVGATQGPAVLITDSNLDSGGASGFGIPTLSTSTAWHFQVRYEEGSNFGDWSNVVRFNDLIAPIIQTGATHDVDELKKLAIPLQANETIAKWEVVGGLDESEFQVAGSTLRWTFDTTQNHAQPRDHDFNNVYNVTIRATDLANNSSTKALTVNVRPLDTTIDVPNFGTPTNLAPFTNYYSESYTVSGIEPGIILNGVFSGSPQGRYKKNKGTWNSLGPFTFTLGDVFEFTMQSGDYNTTRKIDYDFNGVKGSWALPVGANLNAVQIFSGVQTPNTYLAFSTDTHNFTLPNVPAGTLFIFVNISHDRNTQNVKANGVDMTPRGSLKIGLEHFSLWSIENVAQQNVAISVKYDIAAGWSGPAWWVLQGAVPTPTSFTHEDAAYRGPDSVVEMTNDPTIPNLGVGVHVIYAGGGLASVVPGNIIGSRASGDYLVVSTTFSDPMTLTTIGQGYLTATTITFAKGV